MDETYLALLPEDTMRLVSTYLKPVDLHNLYVLTYGVKVSQERLDYYSLYFNLPYVKSLAELNGVSKLKPKSLSHIGLKSNDRRLILSYTPHTVSCLKRICNDLPEDDAEEILLTLCKRNKSIPKTIVQFLIKKGYDNLVLTILLDSEIELTGDKVISRCFVSAVAKGYTEIAKVLVDRQVLLGEVTTIDYDHFLSALKVGSLPMYCYLRSISDIPLQGQMIQEAIDSECVELVDYLFTNYRHEVTNVKDHLHRAIVRHKTEVIKLLHSKYGVSVHSLMDKLMLGCNGTCTIKYLYTECDIEPTLDDLIVTIRLRASTIACYIAPLVPVTDYLHLVVGYYQGSTSTVDMLCKIYGLSELEQRRMMAIANDDVELFVAQPLDVNQYVASYCIAVDSEKILGLLCMCGWIPSEDDVSLAKECRSTKSLTLFESVTLDA